MTERLSIRIELDGEVKNTFLRLKEIHNFKTNTECIRWCITEAAKDSNINLSQEQLELIEELISKPFIKKKFMVFNQNEFIKKAVDSYIETIRSSMPSIQDWDVRNHLTEDDLEVALAIIKIQADSPLDMVTIEQIASELKTKNFVNLRNTLKRFVEAGILDQINHRNQTYYHARK